MYIIESYSEFQPLQKRYPSRRSPKINGLHKRNIIRKVEDKPWISASQVTTDLRIDYNFKVTRQTIRNIIKKEGCNGCVAYKKTFISFRSSYKGLEFPQKHVNKPLSF